MIPPKNLEAENEAKYFYITRGINLHIRLQKQKLVPKISLQFI